MTFPLPIECPVPHLFRTYKEIQSNGGIGVKKVRFRWDPLLCVSLCVIGVGIGAEQDIQLVVEKS